jgi:hypothetical protein
MTNTEEEFDLAPQIDEPMNSFKVVHLYNKSDIYHLTRQVLLDSTITQNTYCVFYHILTKNLEEFNEIYGSFACLIERNRFEADLYLNVDSKALGYIVRYIQTGKLDGKSIYVKEWKTIDEIIDLATMFGMPVLVSMMRSLHPSNEKIGEKLNNIKSVTESLLHLYKNQINNEFDTEKNISVLNEFIDENREDIIEDYIKPNFYKSSNYKFGYLILQFFLMPLLVNESINKIHHNKEIKCDTNNHFREEIFEEDHSDVNILSDPDFLKRKIKIADASYVSRFENK